MSKKIPTVAEMWEQYRAMVVPKDAPAVQVAETHRAFCAGAIVLFAVVMRMLDPGEEPTEADLMHMAALQIELGAIGKAFDAEYYARTKARTQ